MTGEKGAIPKVSVVIPVYNMEKYLDECVESVRKQTLSDIEIICVDDGSTDNSPAILDQYAVADGRVKVIHKANSGYGHSMNIGMAACKGEYIGIVEPDDYIKADMMETLYQSAATGNLDMISSDYIRFYGSGENRIFQNCKVIGRPSFYNTLIDIYEERDIFEGNFINPAGLFKREFLMQHDIKHNETPGASYQDVGFCFQVLAFSRRMMILDKAFYCYRQDNPNSSILSKGKMHCAMEEYAYIYGIMKKKGKELDSFQPQFVSEKFGTYLYTLQRLAPEYRREFLGLISDEFREADDKGELDVSVLSDDWKNMLYYIMKNPQGFYEDFMSFRQEIHEKLDNFRGAVIYGAGLIGKRIYDEMPDDDRRKIKGFAVTSPDGNLENYHGIPVKKVDDYLDEREKLAVIIGIAKQNRDSVVDLLLQKQFKYVIVLESLGVNI